MKTERSIFWAFFLNLCFAIGEIFSGIYTGSVAILSDALHDLADASTLGISCLLERKGRQPPDDAYTYGYARYSVMGALITGLILLIGSLVNIANAVRRIYHPIPVDHNGMLIFSLVGVCINLWAALVNHKGHSLNQKAIALHMLEDVLGWVVVLLGSVLIRLTGIYQIDSIMSIGLSAFVSIGACRTLRQVLTVFLEKTPKNLNASRIQEAVEALEGVQQVHHVHIWSLDGYRHLATMHIVSSAPPHILKQRVRQLLQPQGICHVTLELESQTEYLTALPCQLHRQTPCQHHHP